MQSYCHLIYRKLANGEEVRVDGVGTLFLKFRKGRSWKCSFNEEMTTTPDTYYLSVRGSSILREALGELYDSGEGPVPQKGENALFAKMVPRRPKMRFWGEYTLFAVFATPSTRGAQTWLWVTVS